jgi:outer membrane protein OmpA-like peptidoglycan-associated protein
MDETGNHIYFASKRDGTSDIFRVSLLPTPKLSKPIRIKGRVVDGDTGKPIRAELYFGPEPLEGYLEYFHTYTGLFEIELQEYELYKFFARKPGYQPARLMFDARLADMQELDEHYMVLKLFKAVPIDRDSMVVKPKPEITEQSLTEKIARMEVGEKLAFYNIYFEQSKAIVLKESYPAMDTLVAGMKFNPKIRIRIEGHTDNVGDRQDLMELSWQRAEAIKKYLIQNDIDASRVETVGYGPEHPVADNVTEVNRRKNRRVEIRRLEGK